MWQGEAGLGDAHLEAHRRQFLVAVQDARLLALEVLLDLAAAAVVALVDAGGVALPALAFLSGLGRLGVRRPCCGEERCRGQEDGDLGRRRHGDHASSLVRCVEMEVDGVAGFAEERWYK